MIIKMHCPCGAAFEIDSEGGTSEIAMSRLRELVELHKETCRYWEVTERDHNFREAVTNKQLAAQEFERAAMVADNDY